MLAPADLALLDFARTWEGRTGAKASAIREALGLAPARYFQRLSAVIDSRAALEVDAALVYRLRAARDAAAERRASRRFS